MSKGKRSRRSRQPLSSSRGAGASTHRALYLDQDLAMDFLSDFSTFEYALKEAGLRRRGSYGQAEPDWSRFTREIEQAYAPKETDDLAEAVGYLLSLPPRKQVIRSDGSMDWENLRRRDSQTDIDWLLFLVKTVRNNLSHGAKRAYYSQEDLKRDIELLRYGQIILSALINWHPHVRECYEHVNE